ncbi:hypothetical protein COW46_03325 [Candidatus Gracilibacteria bacterium CG17_big_fil_post_rev_8_21_14_2_50_48_13]|nr:MAG: hypothetical protein COW46_03325 [Candidatus Gracilibacteria bacterium CG17_big_fil_post_rev_8_21_14_2_50_48_13]
MTPNHYWELDDANSSIHSSSEKTLPIGEEIHGQMHDLLEHPESVEQSQESEYVVSRAESELIAKYMYIAQEHVASLTDVAHLSENFEELCRCMMGPVLVGNYDLFNSIVKTLSANFTLLTPDQQSIFTKLNILLVQNDKVGALYLAFGIQQS